MKISKFCLCLALLLAPAVLLAEADAPVTVQDGDARTMMSSGFVMMDMSNEEKEQFSKIVGKFNAEAKIKLARELRRDVPNRDRQVDKLLERLFADLDKRVEPLVTEERQAGYVLFKQGLADQMRPGWEF